MIGVLLVLFTAVRDLFRRRADLETELLALRHQVLVLQRRLGPRRVQLYPADRAYWVLLSRLWPRWRDAVLVVKPETVIAWHRRWFRWYWRRKSRARRVGRPDIGPEVVALIRSMRAANPLWGAPRIHGELLKLGIDIAESTVSTYLPGTKPPPSQGWRTFLQNHLGEMIAVDFAVVPTVTGTLLFVFIVLSLARRRILPRQRDRASHGRLGAFAGAHYHSPGARMSVRVCLQVGLF
jgi:putative transposase